MTNSSISPPGWLDVLRRPEYTGENRCIPCTVLNVVIAAALGGGLAQASIPLGIGSFVVFLGAIYARGYLIPYTPTITKRYFPDRVLRWFDAPGHASADDASTDEIESIDVERTLYALGVITECERVDDLCLDPSFEAAWREHIDTLREREPTEADITKMLDIEDEDHEIEWRGAEAAVVLIDGTHVGQWESHAALLADLAADRALREWTEEWEGFHVVNRSQLLNALRMFLEQCAECGAPISVDQETVESCCRSFDVVAVTCEGCGSRYFEMELTDELEQQLGMGG